MKKHAYVQLIALATTRRCAFASPAAQGHRRHRGAAGPFTTLATALEAAGLVETLKGPGPFTVFAPTDEAFAKLPAGTVENLLSRRTRTSSPRAHVPRRAGQACPRPTS